MRLNDREFNMMLKIWDKDNEGEIEFDVFADMFEKTLLVLEVDDTKREQLLAEEDAKEEAQRRPRRKEDGSGKRRRKRSWTSGGALKRIAARVGALLWLHRATREDQGL